MSWSSKGFKAGMMPSRRARINIPMLPIESFGPVVDTSIRFEVPRAHEAGGKLIGEVQHIDRFGNLITNISREDLVSFAGADQLSRVQVDLEHASIDGLQRFYADAPEGTLAALVNSDGWLEIFYDQGRAADLVKAKIGDRVEVSTP